MSLNSWKLLQCEIVQNLYESVKECKVVEDSYKRVAITIQIDLNKILKEEEIQSKKLSKKAHGQAHAKFDIRRCQSQKWKEKKLMEYVSIFFFNY